MIISVLTCKKRIIRKEDVLDVVRSMNVDVLLILGAGDLDNMTPEITKILLPRS